MKWQGEDLANRDSSAVQIQWTGLTIRTADEVNFICIDVYFEVINTFYTASCTTSHFFTDACSLPNVFIMTVSEPMD